MLLEKVGESSTRPIGHNQDLSKLQDSDCSCRLGSKNRIINGEIAEPHLVPWQVSLANTTGYHFCGAIIINHYNILTSAKCLKGKSEEGIKVRVGLHNINDPIPGEKIFDVELIDGFNFKSKYGGMAMLKLKNYIEFIPGKVEPACLNLVKEGVKKLLMVSGWGHTSAKIENTETNLINFEPLSPVLKIGYLKEDRKHCNKNWLCTLSLNGDLPYIADNGGPLHSMGWGIAMVEGVLLDLPPETSIYFSKGNPIFSRLSFYENWIKEKIDKDYCTEDRALKYKPKCEIESFTNPIDLNQDLSKLQNSDCSCRLGSRNRIINGEIAEPHLIPWQVSLANTTGYHFCGAIIINHYNILTSAKCLKDKEKEEIKVRVGLHNINDPIPSEKTYDVELIDSFNFDEKYGGMAMLKLKNYIEFIPGEVEPACLNLVKEGLKNRLIVSGWGHTSAKIENIEKNLITFGSLSPVLKTGYLSEYRTGCAENFICASSSNGDLPCFGDEGGPLHSTRFGITAVEGVLLDLPAKIFDKSGNIKVFWNADLIFSRLSFYKNWIMEKIGEDYCAKYRPLTSKSKRKMESFNDPNGKKELKLN